MSQGKGHYHLNPPPYSQGGRPVFIGFPGTWGNILTDEAQQAFNVVRNFGTDPDKQSYVDLFFDGGGATGSLPEPTTHQLADIGQHFTLTHLQQGAVDHSCANVRAEFLAGLTIAPGLNFENGPIREVYRVGGCQSTTVNVATVGSLYKAICDRFQHNLNVGAHA